MNAALASPEATRTVLNGTTQNNSVINNTITLGELVDVKVVMGKNSGPVSWALGP